MNKKIVFLVSLSALLLITLLFITILLKRAPPSETTIYVDSPISQAGVKKSFMININISNAVDLYGWEFKLRWDPALLDVLDVTEGSFLKGGGETFFVKNINNTEGYLHAACTLLGGTQGMDGNGTLATVKFYVEREGESVLDLYDTKLGNSLEKPITHEAIDGYGHFTIIRDVSIMSVTTSRTWVFIGEVVNITVIARNEGSVTETFNVTSYYNTTAIETQIVDGLVAGAEINVTFNWNTTSISPATYIVKAEASVVPGETEIVDNIYVNGIVRVKVEPEEPTTLYVDPSTSTVMVGQKFTVNVTISNVVCLYGFEFKLSYNTTILDAVSVEIVPFLNEPTFVAKKEINDTLGRIWVAILSLPPAPPKDGNGTLLTITFNATAEGTSTLNLYETKLGDDQAQPISHIVFDGSVEVGIGIYALANRNNRDRVLLMSAVKAESHAVKKIS